MAGYFYKECPTTDYYCPRLCSQLVWKKPSGGKYLDCLPPKAEFQATNVAQPGRRRTRCTHPSCEGSLAAKAAHQKQAKNARQCFFRKTYLGVVELFFFLAAGAGAGAATATASEDSSPESPCPKMDRFIANRNDMLAWCLLAQANAKSLDDEPPLSHLQYKKKPSPWSWITQTSTETKVNPRAGTTVDRYGPDSRGCVVSLPARPPHFLARVYAHEFEYVGGATRKIHSFGPHSRDFFFPATPAPPCPISTGRRELAAQTILGAYYHPRSTWWLRTVLFRGGRRGERKPAGVPRGTADNFREALLNERERVYRCGSAGERRAGGSLAPAMSKRKMSLLSSFENISPQVISRVGREIQDLQRK